MTERQILDLRAGTPWSAEALELVSRVARSAWGNPAHPSSEGRRAATWLEAAEATVRSLTGLPHVSFFADRGAALTAARAAYPGARASAAATHRKQALRLADFVAPVDEFGAALWAPSDVALLQGANEETGVTDPHPGAPVCILDASNSFARSGSVPAADHIVADAAAWGAPGGIALLLGQSPVPAGDTPALPLVALAVHALAAHWPQRAARETAEAEAMAGFEQFVSARVPDVQFHGANRVAHIRSFSILHLDAETLTRALDIEGYVVGSGSACVADGTPSHVLAAMGRVTHGNVRLMLPVDLDLAVLDRFADTLVATVARLRQQAGVADL